MGTEPEIGRPDWWRAEVRLPPIQLQPLVRDALQREERNAWMATLQQLTKALERNVRLYGAKVSIERRGSRVDDFELEALAAAVRSGIALALKVRPDDKRIEWVHTQTSVATREEQGYRISIEVHVPEAV